MATMQQIYPDIELRIDRDDKGNIVQLDYKVNDAGEDGKRIIEFIEMLALLCQQPGEAKRILEHTLPAKEKE